MSRSCLWGDTYMRGRTDDCSREHLELVHTLFRFSRILVVGNRVHPLCDAAGETDVHVSHRLRGCGAVPMWHVRSGEDALARSESPDRLPLFLNERASFLDQKQLAAWMAVPICPRGWLETPAADTNAGRVER